MRHTQWRGKVSQRESEIPSGSEIGVVFVFGVGFCWENTLSLRRKKGKGSISTVLSIENTHERSDGKEAACHPDDVNGYRGKKRPADGFRGTGAVLDQGKISAFN